MRSTSFMLRPRDFLVFIVLSYAIVVSLLVDAQLRNYLVLFAGILGGLLFFVFGLRLQRQAFWAFILFSLMAMQAFFLGGSGALGTVALTFVYALGYFAVASLMERVPDKRVFVQNIMRWIIYAFAIFSVLQLVTSFAGLPVPNVIGSKGFWSYNSLAFEPSQLGRVVGISMLCYLMVSSMIKPEGHVGDPPRRWHMIITAFMITMLLSGSSLAAVAIAMVYFLSRSLGWVLVLVGASFLIWPAALLIDFEPLQRAAILLSNLGSLDVATVLEADHSGGVRIASTLLYLGDAAPGEAGFWMGYGSEGLERFFLGRISGVGDQILAGFLPGFFVVYGIVIAVLFIWVFLVLQTNRISAPLVGFFLLFMSLSAWNTQVFWYGLIVIQMTYAASVENGRRLEEDAA